MYKICSAILISSGLLFTSCKPTETTHSTGEKTVQKTAKTSRFTTGIIIDKTGFDGCTFIIKVNDSTIFEPINLNREFQVDSLAVEFTYRLSRAATICMMGQTVSISEMRKK